MSVTIRQARKEDADRIIELIRDLAEYEKALDQVVLTTEQIAVDGFADQPKFSCLVAEFDGLIVGMALTYPRYSTWKGAYTYLEDLIVDANYRQQGIGTLLLKSVIEEAGQRQSARLEWQVLDWNEPAIAFYRKFNASFDNEWINVRLTKDQLINKA